MGLGRALLTACVCVAAGVSAACVGGAWAGVCVTTAVALICGALCTWPGSRAEETPGRTGAVLITGRTLLGGPVGRWAGAGLIIGCDSGFGHALALRLSGRGLQVFAGVLDSEGDGAKSLRERDPERITVLQMDVTNQEHVAQAKEHIRTKLGDRGLWGLVNNAGLLMCPVDIELNLASSFQRLMEVNFLAAVSVTQAFLPLIRRAKGRVVNMSSLAGAVPMPRLAAYAASKAALSLFSRVLRLEMFQWGVHVALVQPSGFKTKIFGDNMAVSRYQQQLLSDTPPDILQDYGVDYISQLPSSLLTMSQIARQDLSEVLDALEHALLSPRPKALYCPGRGAWLIPFLNSHLPTSVFDRFMMQVVNDTYRPPALDQD